MNTRQFQFLAGIDTGGTFTDLVVLRDGEVLQCKVLSTPGDPSAAIETGLERLGLRGVPGLIVHGTTVATNAVLEGKGARVVYVTSTGFRDVLTLGRQHREQVYRLEQPAVDPPVPAELCLEVSTRIREDGSVESRADGSELASLRRSIRDLQPGAVAINLLFSFLQPGLETEIAEALGDDWFLSLSSQVLPEIREYERGIATWLNASVGPVIHAYLARLQQRLPESGISVMQSSGTTIAADQAAGRAVNLLLSGPAGGLAAAELLGRTTGRTKLLTFDMGGTSTDVSLIDGEIRVGSTNRINRWPLCVPSVDIHTIGAGGGSIARVDEAGLLLVGPESSGAWPGPACYGQGGQNATVTDANLVLGRIPRDTRLGGYLKLDFEAAIDAVSRLAAELGCDVESAARGVIRLANEHMARALRVISVGRGHDPREYTLVSFGGAGGLHACDLARLLRIPRVVLPAGAGVLSALGMLASRPGRNRTMAILEPAARVSDEHLESRFSALEQASVADLQLEGVPAKDLRFRRELELRYQGQSGGIVLEFRAGTDHVEAFHAAHESQVGHRLDHAVEVVSARSEVRGQPNLDSLDRWAAVAGNGDGPDREIPVWERKFLSVGQSLPGPAIVTESHATGWIASGWQAQLDEWGNLVLERADQPEGGQ